jgi:hypothetical protein
MANVGKTIKKVATNVVNTVTGAFKAPPPPQQAQPVIQITQEEAPRNKRMPSIQDPDVIAAGRRTRANALRRKGRASTILTDPVGANSEKLG